MDIWERIISALVTALVTAGVSFLCGWFASKQKKEKESKIQEDNDLALIKGGLRQVLFYFLESKHEFYVYRGYCSSSEKREFNDSYVKYHSLGGNGTGTRYNEDVQGLPEHEIERNI